MVLAQLLDAGADWQLKDGAGRTALHQAALACKRTMFHWYSLDEHDAGVRMLCMMLHARAPAPPAQRPLAAQCAGVSCADATGHTALELAVHSRSLPVEDKLMVVKALLRAGAAVSTCEGHRGQKSALAYAARAGAEQSLLLLQLLLPALPAEDERAAAATSALKTMTANNDMTAVEYLLELCTNIQHTAATGL